MSKVGNQLFVLVEEFLACFPGMVGMGIRYIYIKLRVKRCGFPVYIGMGTIVHGKEIKLGNHVHVMTRGYMSGRIGIGNYCSFNTNLNMESFGESEIKIGNNVMVGANVVIQASEHKYDDLGIPMNWQGHRTGKVVVQDDVWIGSNSVITSDVEIGQGAIVGAGAVVTHNVEPYSIVGGVPARVIGNRRELCEFYRN